MTPPRLVPRLLAVALGATALAVAPASAALAQPDRQDADDRGMARMMERMPQDNPGMAQMMERMPEDNPAMAQMMEQMMQPMAGS